MPFAIIDKNKKPKKLQLIGTYEKNPNFDHSKVHNTISA
jgi:hypothetical protein